MGSSQAPVLVSEGFPNLRRYSRFFVGSHSSFIAERRYSLYCLT
jgi:hypothetical protein